MSSAAIATVTPIIHANVNSPLRWRGLTVGGRIYALCLGLILITSAVATIGYLGLSSQGQALLQYIRVSHPTANAVRWRVESPRGRRPMSTVAENGAEDEVKFINDHNKLAMDAIAAA